MIVGGDPGTVRRLRAPREDQSVLVEPPSDAAAELIDANRRRIAQTQPQIAGRPLAELIAAGRRELIDAARDYTGSYRHLPALPTSTSVFLAGHQPTLFHPGVWLKNFALSALAERHGAVAINLVIDSDTLRSPAIPVPAGSVAEPSIESIAFDQSAPEMPFEERTILDRDLFEGFGDLVALRIEPLVPQPFVRDFWPLAVARSRETTRIGECLAQARHQWEAKWGGKTLELPASRLCGLEAFHWFAVHCLVELPRLWETYNCSLADYRRARGIRSRSHPVPALESHDDWLEAPFWLYGQGARRRRLFARRRAGELILSDRDQIEVALSLATPADAVETLAALPARGIKLRTRALMTTFAARLVFGDLFIHGIGGALYDQLTDLIWRRFLGVDPPGFMVLSGTLQLPIGRRPVSNDDLRRVNHTLRDLDYNPDRHVEPASLDGRVAGLIEEKTRWIAERPPRGEGKPRLAEIRRLNEALAASVAGVRTRLTDERDEIQRRLPAERILAWREYAFCLQPAERLRRFLVERSAAVVSL